MTSPRWALPQHRVLAGSEPGWPCSQCRVSALAPAPCCSTTPAVDGRSRAARHHRRPSPHRPLCQVPAWMRRQVEAPLVAAGLLPAFFVDSVALNMYHDGSEGIQVGTHARLPRVPAGRFGWRASGQLAHLLPLPSVPGATVARRRGQSSPTPPRRATTTTPTASAGPSSRCASSATAASASARSSMGGALGPGGGGAGGGRGRARRRGGGGPRALLQCAELGRPPRKGPACRLEAVWRAAVHLLAGWPGLRPARRCLVRCRYTNGAFCVPMPRGCITGAMPAGFGWGS